MKSKPQSTGHITPLSITSLRSVTVDSGERQGKGALSLLLFFIFFFTLTTRAQTLCVIDGTPLSRLPPARHHRRDAVGFG